MKEGAIIHRYGVLALCETGIPSLEMTVFTGFSQSSNHRAMPCAGKPATLVLTSSISFAPPQAARLIHSAVRPLPTKSPILRGPHFETR